ncbi:potassium transporter Trk, partial [Enterococcus lactis]|nr:potassium transporter Trk [Enterococcus lactis]
KGKRIAHNLVSKKILDYLELSDKNSLAEIRESNPRKFNKTLTELKLRQRFDITEVANRRVDQTLIATPAADE